MISKLKSLKNHQGFIKYFRNTSWLFAEKILRMIVGLSVGVWVTRYLGPEQFGLLSYIVNFVGLFSVISTLGLSGIVVREIVKNKNKNKNNKLIGTAFCIKVVGTVVTLIVVAIVVAFTSNDVYTNTLILIVASGVVFQSFNVVDMYFQAKLMNKYVVYVNTITLFISSIVKIILILNEAQLIAFVYVILFDSVVLAIGFIYFFLTKSNLNIQNLAFNKSIAIDLLRESWPLIFGAFAASIYMKIDQVMIKEIMDTKSVGYYAAAVRLSDVWLFITVILTKSLAPAIINAKNKSRQLYVSRLQKMYDLLVKIAVIVSIIIFLFSNEIIIVLYGKEYSPSVEILNLYIWSIVFVFLSNGSWLYYTNEKLQKIASMRLFYGAIINIVLNIYLIEIFGLKGAAYATLISYSISSYFVNFFYDKTKMNFILQTQSIINVFNVKTWLNPIGVDIKWKN